MRHGRSVASWAMVLACVTACQEITLSEVKYIDDDDVCDLATTDCMVDVYDCVLRCSPSLVVEGNCLEEMSPSGGVYSVSLGEVATPNPLDVGTCDAAGTCVFTYHDPAHPWFVPTDACYACELQDAPDATGLDAAQTCDAVGVPALAEACFDPAFDTEHGATWEALVAAVLAVCGGDASTLHRDAGCEPDGPHLHGQASYPMSECAPWNTVTSSGATVASLLDIEPSTSSLSISLPGGATASTPLAGRLHAVAQPARFAAGIAAGLSTQVDGEWYDEVRFGFQADMLVTWSQGSIVVPGNQLGGVWWEATRRSDGERLVQDLSPSQDAVGFVDLSAGTWSLGYQQVLGQHIITVALAGTVVSESAP